MCGVCVGPNERCTEEWFCPQFSETYCSASGTVYLVNGVSFVKSCPLKCKKCSI